MKNLSLKTKMATAVSVLFLIIFSSGAFFFEKEFENHFKKIIEDQQFELITDIAENIDSKLLEGHKALISISRIMPTEGMANYLDTQKKVEKIFKNQFFLRTFFDYSIILFSKTGRVISEYPFNPERFGKDLSLNEYFQHTIKTKKPYISKPYISSKPPHDPVLMFTAPVFNKQGEVVAILGGSVSLTRKNMLGELAHVKIGKTGYLYLYNTDRTIIVHPDKSRVLKQDVPHGANKLFDAAIDGFEGTGETITSRGAHVVASFKRLNTVNWILAANYPIKEAFGPIHKSRWYIFSYTVLCVLLSILVIVVLMRKFLTPLSELALQAEEIGKTEGTAKYVKVEAGGEIGALSVAFNAMLERLNQRQEALQESLSTIMEREARISTILNNAIDGIITINEDKTIETFNPASERIFGYNAAEVVGQNIKILMPELYQSQHNQFIENYLKTGIRKIIGTGREVVGKRKDGSIFPLELSVSEVNFGTKKIFTGILRDITDRKKAEKEILKLSRAVEYSSAVVIITDANGIIEYVNPKFVKVTGYSKEDAIGKTPNILKSDKIPADEYKRLWDTITSGKEWIGIFLNRKKNNQYYWASASISSVKDSEGVITHFVGIQEDITAMKGTEETLKKAKEAAEAANIAKSDFLASMSHEIRTPMNAIIGMSDLLLDTPLTPEQLKYVQVFKSAGENLLNIINDILDLSKIESGNVELEMTEFNIFDLIEKTCDIMAFRTNTKGVEIVYHIMPDVPELLIGDPARLRQILINLMGNAIKFTEKGEIALTVSQGPEGRGRGEEVKETFEDFQLKTQNSKLEGVTLNFSIRDTGIGIPQKKLDIIFDKFTQADPSTTRKYGGTGLGLPISKRLVELMGGTIWVNSEENAGSTFHFIAQFQSSTTDNIVKTMPVVNIKDLKTLGGKMAPTLRILLVDDSPDNRLLIQAYLKDKSYIVDTAENGQIALDKFKTNKYDIVLMDIQMPIMDGHTATKEMRKWETNMGISPAPIIALTAYALKDEMQKSLDAGCDGHLTKPIKKITLLETLKSYTGRQ